MTEVRQAREVDAIPQELRFVPQVKSDIIIQRRKVAMAPIEGMNEYTRDGTNTITFNIQGHKDLNQLLDTKSLYFSWQTKFKGGLPVEDCSMLIEEVIISSNGRTLERIRHAQYIQHFLRGYGMSRSAKARLGKREGFSKYEDPTVRLRDHDDVAAGAGGTGDHGFLKATDTASEVPVAWAAVGGAAADAVRAGDKYTDQAGTAGYGDSYTRMSENLGYDKDQVNRNHAVVGGAWSNGAQIAGWPQAAQAANGDRDVAFGYKVQKFRLPCSGLLACDKMLPIGWCPLTIQLRLSDKQRATDKGLVDFDYVVKRPRMHFQVCSVGQAYANAMQARLRGPGITINAKLFDTFFQIINSDKQIVIPSNKQRLSKVYMMLHEEASTSAINKNAFRSSVSGGYLTKAALTTSAGVAQGDNCVASYQYQVGTEVSEAVTLENTSKGLVPAGDNPNTGMAFLEAYLRSIGAVNGAEQTKEFWGKDLDYRCNDWEGGNLLQTFLSKYFVAVFDGEKLLGSGIETGIDTEQGKDIICDLRFKTAPLQSLRMMCLIQYHAQLIIKENSVELSF
jgi:hypothetical protein